MNKILIHSKGYELKIYSSENDGDNRKTITKYFDNEFEAKLISKHIKKLFYKSDITNDENEHKDFIISYLTKHSDFYEYALSKLDNKKIFDYYEFVDWLNEFLGYSDFYTFREIENIELHYYKENIYAEKIKIN